MRIVLKKDFSWLRKNMTGIVRRGREAVGVGNCSQYLRWIRTGVSLIQEKQFNFGKQFSNIFIIWYFEYTNL